ncbi:MAG: SDR family NAD(P)-dependent oxidoreductase [Mucinivorans sp.]
MWAVVTGASSGIGLCYAKALSEAGYSVVLVSNQQEQLDSVASTFQGQHKTLCVDLATAQASEVVWKFCEGLQVEVLINNAGFFFFKEHLKTSPAKVEAMIYLHIVTVTKLCELFALDMVARHKGYILNMSSLSAWMPLPGIGTYAATKAYIRNWSRSLHYELRDSGVKVTVVCPGAVDTPLYNLSPKLRHIAVKLGIMMPPEKLVRQALGALFRGRMQIVPGVINRLFIPLINHLPHYLVMTLKRKLL